MGLFIEWSYGFEFTHKKTYEKSHLFYIWTSQLQLQQQRDII